MIGNSTGDAIVFGYPSWGGVLNKPNFLSNSKLRDFADGLTGDGYTLVAGAMASTSFASSSKPTLSSVTGLTYQDMNEQGDHFTNQWFVFRLPNADIIKVETGSIQGEYFQSVSTMDAENLGSSGGNTYYTIQIDDKPAGDQIGFYEFDELTASNLQVEYDNVLSKPDFANLYETKIQSGNTLPSPVSSAGTRFELLTQYTTNGDVPFVPATNPSYANVRYMDLGDGSYRVISFNSSYVASYTPGAPSGVF